MSQALDDIICGYKNEKTIDNEIKEDNQKEKWLKVIRFSENMFEPQLQTHHMNHIDLILDEDRFIQVIKNLNEYQQSLVKLSRTEEKLEFLKKHYNDFKSGVWVFLSGYTNKQSLNHLNKIPTCFSAYLPSNTICYDVNFVKELKLSDGICKAYGCYIPERCLDKIKDIKQCNEKVLDFYEAER